ncbi:hypothetical protein CSB66_4916 [Enterobacter hormaechei]|nr:hypothetical protein CSC02_4855 [Enterobacter hormaechei subsp. hoffmannii]RCG79225.1 hypothetical protein CSB66_4916 [Enterobacter hormaechei]
MISLSPPTICNSAISFLIPSTLKAPLKRLQGAHDGNKFSIACSSGCITLPVLRAT